MFADAEILEACIPILESIPYHDTTMRHERRYITGYQVWELLKNAGHEICERLNRACNRTGSDCEREYVGKGAGSNVGPVQRISKALGGYSRIETQYMDTHYMKINDKIPSGEDCGLFRLP